MPGKYIYYNKKRIFLFVALLIISIVSLCGCNEELLQKLTPEQRAYVMNLLKLYSDDPQIQSQLASITEEAEVSPSPVLETELQKDNFLEITDYTLINLSRDDQCSELIDRAPRGLACLHCMQENAREQAKIISTLLFRSCLKNIALNVLVDGTFGFDAEFLSEQVGLLTSNGRKLHLLLYISNGPTQRRYHSTPIDSFATKISPSEFRERIKRDDLLKNEYKYLAERILPVIAFESERGAEVLIVPALEDNLDKESFEAILNLTKEVIPEHSNIKFGRNPCKGCASGSDDYVPSDVFMEQHISSSSSIKDSAYVVTNDGKNYSFDGQGNYPDLNEFRRARDQSVIFILWKGERQGIYESSSFSIHPDNRDFEIPSLEERKALIDFLRE